MKSDEVVAALAALAQESRLAIFRLLVKRGPQGFTPGEMAERIEIPAPTLSFHLKGLQRAGLLSVQRQGRFLHYSANFTAMQGLIDFLTEKCCTLSDAGCETTCAPPSTKRRA